VMNNAAKSFDILATGLSVLYNYFDYNYVVVQQIYFQIYSYLNF